MNRELRIALLANYGSQTAASKVIRINEPALSRLVQGHRGPTAGERMKLRAVFSNYQLRKFFPKLRVEGGTAQSGRGKFGRKIKKGGCGAGATPKQKAGSKNRVKSFWQRRASRADKATTYAA